MPPLRLSTRPMTTLFSRSTLSICPTRAFATTPLHPKLMGSNPSSNLPDPHENSSASPNAKVRTDTQNTDKESSASDQEHLSGDDHPAKQPDPQAEPTRATGIGSDKKVKGGKEGLDERTEAKFVSRG